LIGNFIKAPNFSNYAKFNRNLENNRTTWKLIEFNSKQTNCKNNNSKNTRRAIPIKLSKLYNY
jgi:hypothetical protein